MVRTVLHCHIVMVWDWSGRGLSTWQVSAGLVGALGGVRRRAGIGSATANGNE